LSDGRARGFISQMASCRVQVLVLHVTFPFQLYERLGTDLDDHAQGKYVKSGEPT